MTCGFLGQEGVFSYGRALESEELRGCLPNSRAPTSWRSPEAAAWWMREKTMMQVWSSGYTRIETELELD
jgi:hypothetical protein